MISTFNKYRLVTLMFFFLNTPLIFAQTKSEIDEVFVSKDISVLKNFIDKYPESPISEIISNKMVQLFSLKKEDAIQKDKKNNLDNNNYVQKRKNDITAEVLTKLLNPTNPNEQEIALKIVNTSNCDIEVDIKSKNKNYNLKIPTKDYKYTLIEKGNYEITSIVCDKEYYNKSSLVGNFTITY
jgi:hypothetical protein